MIGIPPFFSSFFFFSIHRVSRASGLGWIVSEFAFVLLLDGSCVSIFLSVIASSAFASVVYIGASITEIINRPSLIFFSVMFLTWLPQFFIIWNHTAITHDICVRREKLKENWRQGSTLLYQLRLWEFNIILTSKISIDFDWLWNNIKDWPIAIDNISWSKY